MQIVLITPPPLSEEGRLAYARYLWIASVRFSIYNLPSFIDITLCAIMCLNIYDTCLTDTIKWNCSSWFSRFTFWVNPYFSPWGYNRRLLPTLQNSHFSHWFYQTLCTVVLNVGGKWLNWMRLARSRTKMIHIYNLWGKNGGCNPFFTK